jgi:hypothetical protein
MDTQTALLTRLHGILTADATLIAAMGGTVRLYHLWGVEDAVMPYLVHRIDLRANDGEWVTRSGTYILDIWSLSDSGAEALAIRDRVITLLEELNFTLTDGATHIADGCRIWLQTEGFIPESADDIWHYATQWNLRFARTAEIANILNRT